MSASYGHGVNCTGSCSWKIYVKGGIVTWETQQTDYPRTRADLPNHEPRGCARGASYSWYLYSANRLKYPMVRGRLLERWRSALKVAKTPVDAWALIVEDPAARRDYQKVRGMYRVMAIANYEDRFVIPTTHREYAENAFNVRGGCGFSFGNGCSEGVSETSLFGSEKKRTIPIKAEV